MRDLEDANGWYKISSGGITGYVKSEYILTGDEAKQAAMNHAELNGDRPCGPTECENGAVHRREDLDTDLENERYHVAEQLDGWVKIEFDESGEVMETMKSRRLMYPQSSWRYDMPCPRRSNSHRRKKARP